MQYSADPQGCLKAVLWVLALVAAWHHAGFWMVVCILLAEVRVKFR